VVYPVKKDWWIACLLFAIGLVMVGISVGAPVLLIVNPGRPAPPEAFLIVAAVSVLQGCIGVFLWSLLFKSSCAISPPDLVVRLGPFGFRIPLVAIVEVVPKRGISPDWGWGLSLSTDRLSVRYRKANGRIAFPIIISPERKFDFLLELAEAVPELQAGDDGSLRLPEDGSGLPCDGMR
jgi:hypothetical protein